MICDVCDKPGAEHVFLGYVMHESCAPKSWVKDHKDRDDCLARVEVWWAGAPAWKRNMGTPK